MSGENDSKRCRLEKAAMDVPTWRTSRRLLCADLVTIRWNSGRGFPREEVAVLEDYSATGAGLFIASRIDPETFITLRTEQGAFAGWVQHCSWRENGYVVGVEFDRPWLNGGAYYPDHALDLPDLADPDAGA